MMEAKGLFEANPANPGSRFSDGTSAYSGPVKFPKMLYHPQGLTEVTVPAVAVETPFGPQWRGEQKQIICKTVGSVQEEEALLAEGWHEHPAHAMEAAGLQAPPISSGARIDDLQRQIEKLTAERNAARALVDRALPPAAAPSLLGKKA